jgi:hypothetical protein
MSVTLLNVLNTVTALGTDVRVDANGYLNLQGTPAFKTSSISEVVITPYVPEVAQVSTVTIGSTPANALFSLSLICNDVNSGMITSVPFDITSDSSTSTTEIAAAFAAAINGMPELSVTATSTTTLVVTAKAGFPIFTLVSNDSKLTVSSTAGVVGVGTGTSLIAQYPSTAGYYNAGGFSAAANIVATNNYTQVLVTSTTGSSAEILIKYDATNVGDLLGTYGTITGLKAGYRVTGIAYDATVTFTGSITGTVLTAAATVTGTITVGDGLSGTGIAPGTFVTAQLTGTAGKDGTYSVNIAPTSPTGSITITSGVVTIATNVATFTSATSISMGILPGDFIVGDPSGTPAIGYVLMLSADGTAVYNNAVIYATNANVTAKGYNVFKWRALPL